MIFGRKRKDRNDDAGPDEQAQSTVDAATDPGVADQAEADATTDWRGGEEQADPFAGLDARDWRADGPFDIDEVDLEGDAIARMDLGALVLTPVDGMEVRFQVEQSTARATAVLLLHADSAMELSLFAAPRSGGLWADVRQEVLGNTRKQGGTAELAEGPFGVEVRRMLPVKTPDGKQGLQPSRMLMVEGPRWALRAVVYGQAAVRVDDPAVTAELREVFRDTVVRRGDLPMPPGNLIPLTLPPDLEEKVRAAAQAQEQAGQQGPTQPQSLGERRVLPEPSGQSTAIQG